MAERGDELSFADQDRQEEPWEERTLNLLDESKIDQEFSEAKLRKKGGKKHKLKWMKRPMAVSEVILEFLDEELRENALRALGNFLLDEVVEFFGKMIDDALNIRSAKRLANVLTLFQCVAANREIRRNFIDCELLCPPKTSCIPNFLLPIIVFKSELEVLENVRAIALSVIGILCQISMHILEYILRDPFGRYFICHPNVGLLEGLMETWNQLSLRRQLLLSVGFH
ncbi:unnamed protein product [Spirodela intermedia]|uniref:Uncharacterized protein n=2 Tax=Spirodela intermedia TaxID=51605 RepID=A0A7I8IXN1_SPIIN|nr:unnamed protein product [Spirodela intermedia]CAA6662608.1 unnamed protein product [Spirodela intermedia]CAA7399013.1 unnamed protein product [Spirodela intermedia]